MPHPKTLLSLSLLFIVTILAVAADDAAVMSKFLKSLSPPPSGWSSTTPFCQLTGIKCDSSNRVTTISLASHSLTGTIPSDLNSLSQLTMLSLTGELPESFFDKLPGLQSVRLSYNNLTGALPSSLADSAIEYLWLNNQDSGLSGTIAVLSNMTQLTQVWLHKNQFTGPIPDLSQCQNLFDLQLRDNQLTGLIPNSLMGLSSLQNVSLYNNELQGPFPAFDKGVKVTLDGINSFCQDTPGPCDTTVMVLLQIAEAFGYPIKFAGSWKGNDPCQGWRFVVCDSGGKIVMVNLAKQGLEGTISHAFDKLTDLRSLNLNGNNLSGSIPESLTTLSRLETLDVSDNNVSGEVPKFPLKLKLVTAGNALLGQTTGPAPGGSPGGSG